MQDRPLIGYVFQSPRLLPWKTVGDNIRLALQRAGVAADEWKSGSNIIWIWSALKNTSTNFRSIFPADNGSGLGWRALWRSNPIWFLMDEPFASVDELTARQLRQTTRRLCEQLHRTVLFVTHNLAEAAYMSDFVVTLTRRPARLDDYVTNPLPTPRQWGPEIYGFAAELETKVTLKEEGDL